MNSPISHAGEPSPYNKRRNIISNIQPTMSSLTPQQADRLVQHINGIEQLLNEVDEAGAEEILEELYLLITQLYDQFPALDKDEDED